MDLLFDFYTLTSLVPSWQRPVRVAFLARIANFNLCQTLRLINRVSSLILLLYSSLGNLGPTNCPLLR